MPSRQKLIFALVVLVIAGITALGTLWFTRVRVDGPVGSGAALVGGPFTLTDQNGKRVTAAKPEPGETPGEAPGGRVFRVNGADRRKPITLDEALIEIGKDRDYLAYRDADTERLAVLIRRRDGHFDLIES